MDQIKSLSESIQKTTQSIVEQIEHIEEAAENNPVLIDDTSEHSFSPKKSGTNTPRSLADLDQDCSLRRQNSAAASAVKHSFCSGKKSSGKKVRHIPTKHVRKSTARFPPPKVENYNSPIKMVSELPSEKTESTPQSKMTATQLDLFKHSTHKVTAIGDTTTPKSSIV